MNAFPDRILLEARDSSLQLEQLAVDDLKKNLGHYLEPNWRAHRIVRGYEDFVKSLGTNDEETYLHMRAAFSETSGKSNKVFSDVLSTHIHKTQYDMSQSLFSGYVTGEGGGSDNLITMTNGEDGEDTTSDAWEKVIHGATRYMEKHSFWVCKFPVPDRIVTSLREKTIKRMTEDHGDKIAKMMKSKEDAPGLLKGDARWLMGFEEMYEVAADPLFLSIVQRYLGVPPIFNTPVAFISSSAKPKHAKELSDNAQLYHHDMHRLGFVKMFIYLTDVDEKSGPHTLIRGSHRSRPAALWADGRHDDAAIERNKQHTKTQKITGKAGTVFLVDTSALHKGLRPEVGHRIMAQVQYTNSLFGRPLAASDRKILQVQKTKNKDIEEAAALVRKYAVRSGVRFMQNMI
nr:phytanoyl-CoA dioxygenase family protein [uncultured Shinella sp.]